MKLHLLWAFYSFLTCTRISGQASLAFSSINGKFGKCNHFGMITYSHHALFYTAHLFYGPLLSHKMQHHFCFYKVDDVFMINFEFVMPMLHIQWMASKHLFLPGAFQRVDKKDVFYNILFKKNFFLSYYSKVCSW